MFDRCIHDARHQFGRMHPQQMLALRAWRFSPFQVQIVEFVQGLQHSGQALRRLRMTGARAMAYANGMGEQKHQACLR